MSIFLNEFSDENQIKRQIVNCQLIEFVGRERVYVKL